jgi:predicted acylesterase/phospholipase RssA
MVMKNLVLAGGGIKCLAYIGVLRYFEEKNTLKDVKNIAGTSMGAIMGMLISLGYTSEELEYIIKNIDMNLLEDVNIDSMLSKFGIDKGNKITYLLGYLLKHKNFKKNLTFSELLDKRGIKLIITCHDLVNNCQKIFNSDLTPEYEVVSACRHSICIPFLFTTGDERYVDGCLSNNLPIDVFDVEDTVGFYIENILEVSNPLDLKSYISRVMSAVYNKGSVLEIEKHILKGYNVVKIRKHTSALNINITKEAIDLQIKAGYDAFINLKK